MDDWRNLATWEDEAREARERVCQLEAALSDAIGWIEFYGGDHGSMGAVVQDLRLILGQDGTEVNLAR